MSSRDQRVVADTPQRSATSASNATQFGLRATSKIKDIHLNRLAIVYVRQSSPQQVMENRESRERQYALAEFAKRLGWTFNCGSPSSGSFAKKGEQTGTLHYCSERQKEWRVLTTPL